MTRKITGCCTLCDKEVFEVITRWPRDENRQIQHPYVGEPRRLGVAHEDAWRLQFLLSGGSTMDLTFCGRCADEVESNMPEIWRRCLGALGYEIEHDLAIGVAPSSATHRFNRMAFHVKLASEVPLGVLSRWKWKDQVDAERAA